MPHMPLRPTVRPKWTVALVVIAALGLGGCGGDAEPAAQKASGPTILQPGKPGEPPATVGPDAAPTPNPSNHDDIAFAQMMVPHHAQALEMARLAQENAASPDVVALARRIQGAQGPEIITLAAWLEERGIQVPTSRDDASAFDHGEHGHQHMAGMLSDEQMEALRAARGKRFDRLFLEGMIRHHAGAIEMAATVGSKGSDTLIAEMAADVTATQAAEITRMKELLGAL